MLAVKPMSAAAMAAMVVAMLILRGSGLKQGFRAQDHRLWNTGRSHDTYQCCSNGDICHNMHILPGLGFDKLGFRAHKGFRKELVDNHSDGSLGRMVKA